MKIDTGIELTKIKETGAIILTIKGTKLLLTDEFCCTEGEANYVYKMIRRANEDARPKVYKAYVEYFEKRANEQKEENNEQKEENKEENASVDVNNQLKRALNNMINFFKEFNFTPSFRFVNTLARKGIDEAKQYVLDYFCLMDSPYAEEVSHKIDSPEFNGILNDFFVREVTQIINKRFKVYYGAQGTGKTTQALEETANRCIVCNASMMPADLMEDFTFDDGKAVFHPSALAKAMEAGEPITLDEINLLPFDSLRFLQGIFDGKSEFLYKGNAIHIADGFKVIGTMNLAINGAVYGLPAPLVDRCEDIENFELDADCLMNAI